jgi:Rod binding domain-containing protein
MAISPVLPTGTGSTARTDSPQKVHDAAQQFEALLMGQILRSARQGGSGWLGGGEDSSAECATDYAEQQLASVLAQGGGLGLADLIAKGLERNPSTS